MKYIVFLLIVLIPSVCLSGETTICNDNDRCINTETNARFGFTFTPSYKNQYQIDLLDIDASCEDDAIPATDKVPLPKNSYFRQTLDKDAQTSNELMVHVYELDKVDDGDANTDNTEYTIEKYFSAPHKVCLNGKHRVQKSNYKRVGGVSTGVLVVPFKLRDGDLYSDSTIGPYLSYKWEVIEILATAGLSQISVSEVGTEDVESETGLTAAIGINFEIDKNWDVALLLGADHLSGDKGDEWEYQDDIWISFGIGFNFTR
ncbi:hypothetical protein [Pseudomaricurvus sp. HS19]|uniref:hypothetical protein n=1 Tax=Pseudomaricurvus sp. HS19 TaxID=2692626 RepID=UPI00136E0EFF|nr:hypothetical protein [Pseudomaricurvus sp. HS19]MYM62413.1 hypothetical protein [Pseudomaricurvus sp. HS19]